MKIADWSVLTTCPGRNYVLVKLVTPDGTVGWGDATLNGRERAVEATLEHHVLPEIADRSVDRIEDTWQTLFRHTYWRGGPVLNTALAAVDMALWDIKGKRYGAPVYDLLGGRTRNGARIYQHCGGENPEAVIDTCTDVLDDGISTLRLRIDDFVDVEFGTTNVAMLRTKVRDVRAAIGTDPWLILDAHGQLDPAVAARTASALEDLGFLFFEDPTRPEDIDQLSRVREGSTIPLAFGEVYTSPWEYRDLIERDLVDYVRPDVVHTGGITALRKIAILAEHYSVRTAFHAPSDVSPLGFAATLHTALSIPNFGIQELPGYLYQDDQSAYQAEYALPVPSQLDTVFSGVPELDTDDSVIDIDDTPGLGVDIDEERAREYDYVREPLPKPRNGDGSVRDW
ncbi:enolase C-terminal domain-like protein [Halorubrum trueperi]|uniref:Enolase C-terminal domain-like protein n=1 Tax=Halorubrum trueperi TaxID=2004704 RepID=A0ABD5UGU3_9EURY